MRPPTHRFRALLPAAVLATAAAAIAAAPARAQESDPGAREEEAPSSDGESDVDGLTPEQHFEIGLGIRNGLRFLASEQGGDGRVGIQYPVATTALAGLAFMGNGSTYNRGPHARNIQRAVDYLISSAACQRKPLIKYRIKGGGEIQGPGYFFNDGTESGRMHGHGFATLFLAQVYGTMPRDLDKTVEVAKKLRGALLITFSAQNRENGGWGYHHIFDAGHGSGLVDEASVTVTQIQGLRAARNAGFQVPATVIEQAVDYVKECMNEDGSCRYSLKMRQRAETYELAAAAVSTLNASGVYSSKELENGLNYLARQQAKASNPARAADGYYYYGNFYAAQAMFQAGPTEFAEWFGKVHQDILDRARPRFDTNSEKGCSWEDDKRAFGKPYATAIAVLILELPQRLLPIFQR